LFIALAMGVKHRSLTAWAVTVALILRVLCVKRAYANSVERFE